MNAVTTIAAVTGVLAAGIIYGTDVFCALVQRPALAQLDDTTMAAAMGRLHQYGGTGGSPLPESSASSPPSPRQRPRRPVGRQAARLRQAWP